MKKIVFVCHGNICRSTMAEFVMKSIVKEAGKEKEYLIESRATSRDEIGADTHLGTKRLLRKHGIPFTPRRATQLVKKDGRKYDLLIGMDRQNLQNMHRILGADAVGKLSILLTYAGEENEIADPWYSGDFETTYAEVLRGCTALFAHLEAQ